METLDKIGEKVDDMSQDVVALKINRKNDRKDLDQVEADLRVITGQIIDINAAVLESKTAVTASFKTVTVLWGILIAFIGLATTVLGMQVN